MNSYLAEWFELECVLSPSVKREKTIDIRKEVDWKAIEQSLFGAAISKPFYTLNDSLVLFNDGIYLAVRGCLQNA